MNPGVGEEVGKTTRGLIESMKDSPITLALVLFNLLFVVIVFFSVRDQRAHMESFQTELFKQQTKTMEMLYNCTPGAKT
jgi:preprotein translocase subunit YajC